MIFCNVVYVMESLFRKTVSSHAWNDTKKITITIENGIAKFFIFLPSEFVLKKWNIYVQYTSVFFFALSYLASIISYLSIH